MSLNFIRSSIIFLYTFIGLAKIDIFGQTITLNMNKHHSYTTAFGGLSSILIICLLSLMFFSNIASLFARDNVYYSGETIFSNDPELIQMNDENYMLAVSIDQVNFTTNPFFNISIEQRIYQKVSNGTMIKSTIELPLQPCKLERFNNLFQKEGIDFTDQFNFLGMKNMLCPVQNYTFQLEGTFSSEVFKFIKIIVKSCKNSTENSFWNPTCSDDIAPVDYLNVNGQFKLQLFQINTVMNPQKARNYKTVYIDTDMYFSFVPFKLARLANIFYRTFLVNNDDSLLPYEDIQQENIIVRKSEDFRDLTELGRDTDDLYAVAYLRRSQFTEKVNRRYQKLGDLLAYLGGFMQIMRVIFGFVIAFYNRTSMLIELSNKLYDFKDDSENRLLEQQTLKFAEQLSSPALLGLNSMPNNRRNCVITVEWKNLIQQLVQKSNPITFNVRLFINQLSCGYLLRDKNSQYLDKAILRINNELNLDSILYQLHEIYKLKQVLLRKSQIILFNFSPKPIITLGKDQIVPSRFQVEDDDYKKRLRYAKTKADQPKEELFYRLQGAYQDILEEMETNSSNLCQMNINLKLTQLIGQDIKKLLKQDSTPNNKSPNQFDDNNNEVETPD